MNSSKVCNHNPVRITEGAISISLNKGPPTRFVQGHEVNMYKWSQLHDSGLGGRDEKTKGIWNERKKGKRNIVFVELWKLSIRFGFHGSNINGQTKSSENISENKKMQKKNILHKFLHRTMKIRTHQHLLVKCLIKFGIIFRKAFLLHL